MKKLFFIACFIVCVSTVTISLSSRAESPVEQLVRIMMSNTKPHIAPLLAKERNPNDYQEVYNLAKKHPKLLKGIIYDGRTFAVLCVQKGYADVLERLINEDCLVDLATPCNLYGPHESQTTVLHQLFSQVRSARMFIGWKNTYSEDYTERIIALTKLIIAKYPDLLDIPVNREATARLYALRNGVHDLIPDDLPQSSSK